MIANMNEKGRQTKLLAAIAVLAMVVCAFAVVLPAEQVQGAPENYTPVVSSETKDVKTLPAILSIDSIDDLSQYINTDATYGNVIYVPTTGSEIILTGDVTGTLNAGFILDGNLTFKSSGQTPYKMTIASSATTVTFNNTNYNIVFYANADAEITFDNVDMTVDNVAQNAHTLAIFNNMYEQVSLEVKAQNNAKLTLQQTGTVGTAAGDSGTTWLTTSASGKTQKLTVNNADVVLDKVGSIQAITVNASNGATIDANMENSTFTGYFNLNNAEVSGNNVSAYAAVLVKSSITATTFGTYTGSNPPADLTTFTINTISVDKDSMIDAGRIINDLSATGSTEGASTVKFTNGGQVSGNFTDVTKTGSESQGASFNLDGITLTGTNTVSSGVTLDGKYTIGEKSALNVNGGATLKGTITNNGTMSISSDAITADSGKSYITISNESTGSVNVTGSSDAVLGGTIDKTSQNTDFGIGQIVNVVDDLTIDGATITINGVLNNSDGYSIDIINGGKLIINGSLASFTNDGNITVDYTSNSTSTTGSAIQITSGAKFVNNGTVTLENNTEGTADLMTNAGITDNFGSIEVVDGTFTNSGVINNKAGATLTLGGTFTQTGTLNNVGSVVVDGTMSSDVAVNNVAEGASVSIVSVSGKFTVKDNTLESRRTLETGDNIISLNTNTTSSVESVGGITITSVVTEIDDKYYKEMHISGTVDVTTTEENENGAANIYSSGSRIVVSETLNIGENLNFTLATDTNFIVSGTMNITDKAAAKFNAGIVKVTGSIVSVDEITATQIDAAMYSNTVNAQKLYYYKTLDKAIAGASEAGVNRVEVTGSVTLDVDATVPAGMTVTIENGAKLTIKDVTLDVADGGKINNKSLIDVDGTLYITIEKTGISGSGKIESDVVSRGAADVRYTTLANAIAAAGSEEVTITLNGNVLITSDLTIPENITVDTDGYGFNVYGAKLTIDGMLYLNNTEVGTTLDDYYVHDNEKNANITKTGEVVVNGYIKATSEPTYDGKNFPAGAYYYVFGNKSFYYITTVANAAQAAQTADNGITIYGKNTASDVQFTGTADEPVEVTVDSSGVLTVGSLKLTYATLDNNGRIDGTITSDVGSVDLVNVTGVDFVFGTDSDDVAYFAMSGTPAKSGKDITDPDASVTVASGTVSVIKDTEFYISTTGDVEFSVDAAATLAVAGYLQSQTAMTVDGTLDVQNGGTVASTGTLYVLGTITVATATEQQAAGVLSAATVYIGVDDEYNESQNASVTANSINTLTSIYVLNGASVSESIIEDLAYSTGFYVEDTLWITVYTNGVEQAIAPNTIPTENVELVEWNGTLADGNNTTVTKNQKFSAGNPARLDANIDYDIYTVTVFADPGIDAVYIDGKLMTKGYYANAPTGQYVEGFKLDVAAGSHEITYKLGNYFSGKATMTVNGEAVSGNTFTTSGTDVNDRNVTIYLQGIEASAPETPTTSGGSSDDGMGLTDILLIILVILIVVMAIIVALRLMRS